MSVISKQSSGVLLSLSASVSFAVMYFYVTLLKPLNAEQIYGWRICFTVPVLALILFLAGNWGEVAVVLKRVRDRPTLVPLLLFSSFLLGIQLWIFMWAPIHGYGLDVSLGFFLLPLVFVLTGRWVFKEPISKLQAIACGIAAIGVANELVYAPRVSWPTFVVAIGYPIYFTLRKKLRTDSMGGMWIDMALSVPVGLWFIGAFGRGSVGEYSLSVWFLILGLGIVSSVGLACMFAASHRLTLGLYGLMNYVEPVLLVIASLILGERLAHDQWITYGCIWLAIAILIYEGIVALKCPHGLSTEQKTR